MSDKTAICILSNNYQQKVHDLLVELTHPNYDLFLCVDKTNTIPLIKSTVTIINIESKICEMAGYSDTVSYCPNKACSREKGLYYFKHINNNYKTMWFIEDDVFIPSVTTIPSIDAQYNNCDLLSASHEIYNMTNQRLNKWPHWPKVLRRIKPPYAKSMICAIRISNRLLDCIDDYAKNKNTLFFCEAMFNTLALQNNLVVVTPSELKHVVYKAIHLSIPTDINPANKINLFHPMKNIALQEKLRIKFENI